MKSCTAVLSMFLGTFVTLFGGTYGSLEYEIREDGVAITHANEDVTTVEIPESIEGYPVTSIADWAFDGFTGLTSVTIPSSVTSIGGSAFSDCVNLTNLTIPNSVTSIGDAAFRKCSGLTSVIISSSLTSVGNATFSSCGSLTSVIIPDSVTSIGNSAFSGCSRLTSVSIPKSVVSIGNSAFSYCGSLLNVHVDSENPVYASIDGVLFDISVETLILFPGERGGEYSIPDSVTSIGAEAFNSCSNLTSVSIPNSVTSIGNFAFRHCTSLNSVIIPDSVTSIGDGAFINCSALISVTISNSVTSLGMGAFYGCRDLTSVTIPNSITSIGAGAFEDCVNLEGLYFLGLPPSIDFFRGLFGIHGSSCTIFYVEGTSAWPETFSGRPTQPFYPGIWSQATVDDSGWGHLGWFGSFIKLEDPLIYHAEGGFKFIYGEDTAGFYIYDPASGIWSWTSDSIYPIKFLLGSESGWVF